MNLKLLRTALIIIGLIFVFGIAPLMYYWPSGWRWIPPQSEYEQMIVGIYATLGIFLLIAAKEPLRHASLIWFTVWSSAVHATIMLFQALNNPGELPHLWGDVLALYVVAIVLGILMPRERATQK